MSFYPTTLLLVFCVIYIGFVSSRSVPEFNLDRAEIHFADFQNEYNRHYSDENERNLRYEIFKENLKKVNELNGMSNVTVFGITKFMDLSQEEFANKYTSVKVPTSDNPAKSVCTDIYEHDIHDKEIPTFYVDIDQIHSRDQRICNSGYAFSAAENIATKYLRKNKKYPTLSAQQIVDCDTGSDGCVGGTAVSAFESVMDLGGIETASSYPYIAKKGNECRFNQTKAKVQIDGCRTYKFNSMGKLRQAIYQHGTISIAVRSYGFQFYKAGIMIDAICNHGDINVDLLIHGYCYDNKFACLMGPIVIAANFWDREWGMAGTIRLSAAETETGCGMFNPFMSSAIINKREG